jgi:hypothetical protein
MTITGGVVEQRVFGDYGPAAPAQILGDLLQGTGSNMLLRETSSAAPSELILTPREGGVTPPNPDAPGFDGESTGDQTFRPSPSNPDQPAHVLHAPAGFPGRPAYAPIPGTPTIAPAQPVPANPPPNGVLSPEQIYQQLQQLQKTQPQR